MVTNMEPIVVPNLSESEHSRYHNHILYILAPEKETSVSLHRRGKGDPKNLIG